jgi:hypothetical protein
LTTAVAGVRAVDEAALRGVLAQVDPRREDSRVVVVSAAPEWDGPEVLDTDAGSVRVVPGPSVLAVRTALADHADERLVILTALPMSELGIEVQARTWKGRPIAPSPWDAVKALFRVDAIDPSLRDERWMVDLLVRLAPARGYAQPTSQLLDRTTAWRNLYRHALQLPVDDPRPSDVLGWAASPAAAQALDRLDADCRTRIGDHLAVAVGPSAPLMVHLAAAGRGGDALALGLVVDALWPAPPPEARVLLQERHLHRQALSDPAAAEWGRAALDSLSRLDDEAATAVTGRAEALLAEVDPIGTGDSDVLAVAFPRRLARLGAALGRVLDTGAGAVPAAEEALDGVRAHTLAGVEAGRVRNAEAALRLCRRAAAGPPADTGAGLAELAAAYVAEGAWVDAGRHRIAEGETVPELIEVFDRLSAVLDAERAQRDRRFATALRDEATGPAAAVPDLADARLLPIEQVLAAAVAPVARHQPVLVLVVDGLSHAAAVTLLADLRRTGWQPHGPDGRVLPPVLAALPTVTKVSRVALLTGRVQEGGQAVERDGFASHAALRDAAAGQPARLFHKGELRTAGGEIAPAVREALADANQAVVGVVVNGVDDFLGGGDQLRLADGVEGVPILGTVLREALDANRAVVLTSDHGHILGSAQRVVAAPGGGERYRPAGEPAADDEVEVSGARVVGRVVLAAEDGVRYVGYAKHGYHGGATPAEALCPLFVLLPAGVELDGWEPLVAQPPAWWDPDAAPVPVEVEPAPVMVPTAPPTGRRDEAQPSLFDQSVPAAPEGSVVRPVWLEALLASPRLAAQRRLAGRVSLDDDDLALLLRVLVASGGTASGAALERTLGLSAMRLRSKLNAARTLLDVDGYQVLRLEPDGTAALNIDQLVTQFETPRPEG